MKDLVKERFIKILYLIGCLIFSPVLGVLLFVIEFSEYFVKHSILSFCFPLLFFIFDCVSHNYAGYERFIGFNRGLFLFYPVFLTLFFQKKDGEFKRKYIPCILIFVFASGLGSYTQTYEVLALLFVWIFSDKTISSPNIILSGFSSLINLFFLMSFSPMVAKGFQSVHFFEIFEVTKLAWFPEFSNWFAQWFYFKSILYSQPLALFFVFLLVLFVVLFPMVTNRGVKLFVLIIVFMAIFAGFKNRDIQLMNQVEYSVRNHHYGWMKHFLKKLELLNKKGLENQQLIRMENVFKELKLNKVSYIGESTVWQEQNNQSLIGTSFNGPKSLVTFAFFPNYSHGFIVVSGKCSSPKDLSLTMRYRRLESKTLEEDKPLSFVSKNRFLFVWYKKEWKELDLFQVKWELGADSSVAFHTLDIYQY
jgi:hypothetical protein